MKYFLMAKDEVGVPFTWGFFINSLQEARRLLLPETWIVDESGKVYPSEAELIDMEQRALMLRVVDYLGRKADNARNNIIPSPGPLRAR